MSIKISEKDYDRFVSSPFIIVSISEDKICYIENAEYSNVENYINMEGRTTILSSHTFARIDALNGG